MTHGETNLQHVWLVFCKIQGNFSELWRFDGKQIKFSAF